MPRVASERCWDRAAPVAQLPDRPGRGGPDGVVDQVFVRVRLVCAGEHRRGVAAAVRHRDDAGLVADHAQQAAALGSKLDAAAGKAERQPLPGDLPGHELPDLGTRGCRAGLVAPDQPQQHRRLPGGRADAPLRVQRAALLDQPPQLPLFVRGQGRGRPLQVHPAREARVLADGVQLVP